MAKVCRGGALVPEGQDHWVIPALPGGEGEQQCVNSGGTIEESSTGGPCGTESTAQSRGALGGRGSGALALAAVAPVRRLRDSLAHTELVQDLERLNRSEQVHALLEEDPELADRFAEIVAATSEAASGFLTWPGGAQPPGLVYSEQLHATLQAFADDLAGRLGDDELRSALERVTARAAELVGVPLLEIVARMGRDQASTSG